MNLFLTALDLIIALTEAWLLLHIPDGHRYTWTSLALHSLRHLAHTVTKPLTLAPSAIPSAFLSAAVDYTLALHSRELLEELVIRAHALTEHR